MKRGDMLEPLALDPAPTLLSISAEMSIPVTCESARK
jgi:hypothetical protein